MTEDLDLVAVYGAAQYQDGAYDRPIGAKPRRAGTVNKKGAGTDAPNARTIEDIIYFASAYFKAGE